MSRLLSGNVSGVMGSMWMYHALWYNYNAMSRSPKDIVSACARISGQTKRLSGGNPVPRAFAHLNKASHVESTPTESAGELSPANDSTWETLVLLYRHDSLGLRGLATSKYAE